MTAALEGVAALLASCERDEPWAMGLTSLALARALRVPEGTLVRALAGEVEAGRIAQRAGYYALPEHEPRLNAAQRAFFDEHLVIDPAGPTKPANFENLAADVRRSAIPGLSRAFDTLRARGELVRITDSLYTGTQMLEIRRRLEQLLAERGRFTASAFRDALGTSRKYAVPLLEWFDARGITKRDGDDRVPGEGTESSSA